MYTRIEDSLIRFEYILQEFITPLTVFTAIYHLQITQRGGSNGDSANGNLELKGLMCTQSTRSIAAAQTVEICSMDEGRRIRNANKL
jgi:hypothetical protein